MTRAQIVDLMRERGFTHAVTFGGPVLLDDWFPYGRQHALDYRGVVISTCQVCDVTYPPTTGFYDGEWRFVKIITPKEAT